LDDPESLLIHLDTLMGSIQNEKNISLTFLLNTLISNLIDRNFQGYAMKLAEMCEDSIDLRAKNTISCDNFHLARQYFRVKDPGRAEDHILEGLRILQETDPFYAVDSLFFLIDALHFGKEEPWVPSILQQLQDNLFKSLNFDNPSSQYSFLYSFQGEYHWDRLLILYLHCQRKISSKEEIHHLYDVTIDFLKDTAVHHHLYDHRVLELFKRALRNTPMDIRKEVSISDAFLLAQDLTKKSSERFWLEAFIKGYLDHPDEAWMLENSRKVLKEIEALEPKWRRWPLLLSVVESLTAEAHNSSEDLLRLAEDICQNWLNFSPKTGLATACSNLAQAYLLREQKSRYIYWKKECIDHIGDVHQFSIRFNMISNLFETSLEIGDLEEIRLNAKYLLETLEMPGFRSHSFELVCLLQRISHLNLDHDFLTKSSRALMVEGAIKPHDVVTWWNPKSLSLRDGILKVGTFMDIKIGKLSFNNKRSLVRNLSELTDDTETVSTAILRDSHTFKRNVLEFL